jgi:hypothetical protein
MRPSILWEIFYHLTTSFVPSQEDYYGLASIPKVLQFQSLDEDEQ